MAIENKGIANKTVYEQLSFNKENLYIDSWKKKLSYIFIIFFILSAINFTLVSYETKNGAIGKLVSYKFSLDYKKEIKAHEIEVIIDSSNFKAYKDLLSKKLQSRENEIMTNKEKYLVKLNLIGKEYVEELKRSISKENVITKICISLFIIFIISFLFVNFYIKKLAEKEKKKLETIKVIEGTVVIEDLEYEKTMRAVNKDSLILLSPICRLKEKEENKNLKENKLSFEK